MNQILTKIFLSSVLFASFVSQPALASQRMPSITNDKAFLTYEIVEDEEISVDKLSAIELLALLLQYETDKATIDQIKAYVIQQKAALVQINEKKNEMTQVKGHFIIASSLGSAGVLFFINHKGKKLLSAGISSVITAFLILGVNQAHNSEQICDEITGKVQTSLEINEQSLKFLEERLKDTEKLIEQKIELIKAAQEMLKT